MDFLEILFDVFPKRVATVILGLLGVGALIGGIAWHSHEAKMMTACNSSEGRIAQAFNGTALVNCGSSSLGNKLSIGLIVVGALVIVAAIATYIGIEIYDKKKAARAAA